MGYADDLAACCLIKRKLVKALQVVYRHAYTWRYQYNARKSSIMVYGETPGTGRYDLVRRDIKLGGEKVQEKLSYDHVGVTACFYDDDMTGIKGRLSKA